MFVRLDILVAVAGWATLIAAAPKPSYCRDATICIDGINSCGVKFGACYNTCSPQDSPTPPPCSVTPTPTPTPTDDCSSRIVCIDYINDCGQMYGTCVNDCQPWPTLTPPPCAGTSYPTPTPVTPPVITTPPVYTPCAPLEICEDYIDDCGQTYGGCYDTCEGHPSWTKPSCSLDSTTPGYDTPSSPGYATPVNTSGSPPISTSKYSWPTIY